MTWPPGDIHPEDARIPIRGRAHHDGSKTHAQREKEAAEREHGALDSAKSVAEEREQQRKIDATFERDSFGIDETALKLLSNAKNVYQASIADLYEQRKAGISGGLEYLRGYVREQPPVQRSLLAELAWAALDSFSYGLASSVSGLFTSYLSRSSGDLTNSIRKLRHPERPQQGPLHEEQSVLPRGVVSLVGGVVKQGLKKVSAGAIDALDRTETKGPASSVDAAPSVVAFLNAQSDAFVGNFHSFAANQANRLEDVLLSTVAKANPQRAVEVMQAAADAVAAEAATVREAQLQVTLEHWVKYVAQAAMGSVTTQDGSLVIDASRANHTAGEHLVNGESTLPRFDGLVDIGFHVIRPEDPVRLMSAEIRGINNNVADQLVLNGRLRPGIAVRAFGTGGPSSVVTPLTIVRDEAGRITYTDHMGIAGETPSWLSRRAGRKPSHEAELEGATLLLEEILSMDLPIARGETRGLKTDSKS